MLCDVGIRKIWRLSYCWRRWRRQRTRSEWRIRIWSRIVTVRWWKEAPWVLNRVCDNKTSGSRTTATRCRFWEIDSPPFRDWRVMSIWERFVTSKHADNESPVVLLLLSLLPCASVFAYGTLFISFVFYCDCTVCCASFQRNFWKGDVPAVIGQSWLKV